jgi:RimJ/RimL family protein N-acetyltransferase
LREEFRQMRGEVKARDGSVKRIHVFLGGVDAGGHTLAAVDALHAADVDGLQVDVVIGPQNPRRREIEAKCSACGFACHVQSDRMAELMAAADLAIGAGGSATWERCSLGLPTLALCVAENQRRLVEDCALSGLIHAPELRACDSESIALHLRALLRNPLLLRAMSRNGLQAVDGRGAARVLRAMGCGSIAIREAEQADSGRVNAWRNHPQNRAVSGNAGPIDPPVHQQWFAAVLADPDRLLLIGEQGNEAVGVVRFDIRHGEAEVSIYLAPDLAGEGRGAELLHAAEAWLTANRPKVRAIKARVLRDNASSHGLFAAGGYSRCDTRYAKKVGSP